MTDWDAVLMHLRATPGEELLVASGVGTNRCRPLLNKGLKIRAHKTSTVPARFDIYATYPQQAAYRIMSLVETGTAAYFDDNVDNEAIRRVSGWLEANPGRWFIVGETDRLPGTRRDTELGMPDYTARRLGFEAERVNSKVYARLPHPSGLPLSDFVTRSYVRASEPLPKLERDKFDWSLAELRKAAETAAEWLFPASKAMAA